MGFKNEVQVLLYFLSCLHKGSHMHEVPNENFHDFLSANLVQKGLVQLTS